MRVVMLIQRYFPHIGGAERQLDYLAQRMHNRGVDVRVVTRLYQPGLKKYEEINGIPIYRLPSPSPKPVGSLAYTLLSMPLLKQLEPDVIHAHELMSPTTTAMLAKFLFNKPIVATAHRSGPLGDVNALLKHWWKFGKNRFRIMQKVVDNFVLISNEIEMELNKVGIPAERLSYIPNGVDTNRFVPIDTKLVSELRSRLGIQTDGLVVVFSGRLVKEKRVINLLEAWKNIITKHPKALLIILGEGELSAELKEASVSNVLFLGAKEDVVPYLQVSDVFVLPSAAEGLSVAMLEAMSCGIPPLITRVGSNDKVVENGKSGVLIPSDDIPALQNELDNLLSDSLKRSFIGKNARQVVLDNYSLSKTTDHLIDLYERLSKGKKK